MTPKCADYKDESDGRILKYSAVEDSILSCELCGNCPKNSHEVHRCNGTHNTKCQCNQGFFSSSIADYSKPVCVSCTQCPVGTFVAKPCSHVGDTLCADCPEGRFSDQPNVEQCKKCTLCPFGDKVIRNCSKTQDRLCAGDTSRFGKFQLPATRSKSAVHDDSDFQQFPRGGELDHDGDSPEVGANLILLYCAIFGAIIVALVVYVILKRWKLCPADRKRTKKLPAASQIKNSASPMNNNNNNGGGMLPFYSVGQSGGDFRNPSHQYLIPLNYQQPVKINRDYP